MLVVFVPVAVIVWATSDRFDSDEGSRPASTLSPLLPAAATGTTGSAGTTTAAGTAGTVASTTGGPSTATTGVSPTSPTSPATVPAFAEGFGVGRIVVGGVELSVLVADTGELRGQGLRAVTSLEPYEGMLFVFESEDRVGFTMADTLMALSIGFYDSNGVRVGALEMVPCLDGDDSSCPVYRIDAAFRYAIETASGGLPEGDLALG